MFMCDVCIPLIIHVMYCTCTIFTMNLIPKLSFYCHLSFDLQHTDWNGKIFERETKRRHNLLIMRMRRERYTTREYVSIIDWYLGE